jgi:4'-phosphopantetheinyl transferase EntD
MALFYAQTIDEATKLAVWKIEEPEAFFLEKVPLSRQITHPVKRLQHLAGRFLLQYLYPDFPIRLIQIADTRKPYLPEDPYHFSISHCGNYAAAIVSSQKRVGIDIEQPTERILRVIRKFLGENEISLIVPHNTEQLVKMGTLFWSVKEAMFKWYSHGEVDFKEHLLIRGLQVDSEDVGVINGYFAKHQGVTMQVPFRLFEELVLSWVVV